ncbi:Thrombospondin-type laminin G domain and EAR repeat-containing protein [Mytilus edulis]|uniref:Thrombospondin-type laminin G domain and EAR repeat-containing protein n=1 Tax=Mytilus edulis TaxID=6550 RepID=A0A8S3U2F2_MYTED|nr:Thrombospondin-type laminin G domain and EAR repeat-containing protein [Mytilus edulis]
MSILHINVSSKLWFAVKTNAFKPIINVSAPHGQTVNVVYNSLATPCCGIPWKSSVEGQLRDIIFTPGIDATTRACPSRVPRHTHMNNKLPIFPDTYGSDSPGPQWEDCTWMDVGNIAYDLYAKSLKVCVNGIWKHVTVDVKGSSQDVESVIYKWNPSSQLFEEFQSIMTTGAYDWTYFTVEGYHFLALAQAFNGITTLFESRIYVFQKNGFYLFQTMETNGATDWEFFTISGSAFLIVANAYNYGPQNFKNKNTYLTNSVLYRLNIDKKGFERFQVFSTYSAVDWEFFSIDDNSYLIVSNAQNGGNEEEQLTTIYRWQGMDKFVPVHKMSTLPNTDWEVFHEGNDLRKPTKAPSVTVRPASVESDLGSSGETWEVLPGDEASGLVTPGPSGEETGEVNEDPSVEDSMELFPKPTGAPSSVEDSVELFPKPTGAPSSVEDSVELFPNRLERHPFLEESITSGSGSDENYYGSDENGSGSDENYYGSDENGSGSEESYTCADPPFINCYHCSEDFLKLRAKVSSLNGPVP